MQEGADVIGGDDHVVADEQEEVAFGEGEAEGAGSGVMLAGFEVTQTIRHDNRNLTALARRATRLALVYIPATLAFLPAFLPTFTKPVDVVTYAILLAKEAIVGFTLAFFILIVFETLALCQWAARPSISRNVAPRTSVRRELRFVRSVGR